MFSPELTLPLAEAAHLRAAFAQARVILEYGSGGTTVIAAQMPEKVVFSVESDPVWQGKMFDYFADHPPAATLHLHHGDIGPTGDWGHPKNDSDFRRWPSYPNSVWERGDFQNPDLVLIDGRFRVACFLTTLFRSTAPVTVLFDDYLDRKFYHAVEDFVRPQAMIGRMAQFYITPMTIPVDRLGWIISRFHHAQ
jgi:hypothetical protein